MYNLLNSCIGKRLLFSFFVIFSLFVSAEPKVARTLITIQETPSIKSIEYKVAGHSVLQIFNSQNSPLGIRGLKPTIAFQDAKERIWFASKYSDQAIVRYDERNQHWVVLGEPIGMLSQLFEYKKVDVLPHVNDIAQSIDGRVWISSEGIGLGGHSQRIYLGSFNEDTWESYLVKTYPQYGSDLGIFQGQDGSVWFWKDNEFKKYDGNKEFKLFRLAEIMNQQPLVILPNAMNAETDKELKYRHRIQYDIGNGLQAKDGYIWLSTVSGIIRLNEACNEYQKYPQIKVKGTLMYEDQKGRIWFCDRKEINVSNNKGELLATYSIPSQLPDLLKSSDIRVNAMLEDERGQMLFALDNGLLSFNEKESTWTYTNLLDMFPELSKYYSKLEIHHIMKDRSGRIWLTTGLAVIVINS